MNALLLVVLCAAPVAWTARAGWPHPLSTVQDFDVASRAEGFAFAEALAALPVDPRSRVGLKHADLSALELWKRGRQAVVVENLRRAMATCHPGELLCLTKSPSSFDELAGTATPMLEALPVEYARWREDARGFHATYVLELARLAMVSSRTSSEVALLDANELNGETFADRHFLLTFDDGPTPARGETDALLPVLSALDLHTQFFVVGDAMRARHPAKALSEGQCVGSHGNSHQSHTTNLPVAAQLEGWNRELAQSVGPVRWFRPPYGQRTLAQTQALATQGVGVMLWNIDSQDWQAPADVARLEGLVLTLMLLWRRGVVLFHDVHPVARRTVPGLVRALGPGVAWQDCRELTAM